MVDEDKQQQQLVAEERGEGVRETGAEAGVSQGRLYHRGRGRGRGRDVGGGRAQMQALLSTVDQGPERSEGSARGGC